MNPIQSLHELPDGDASRRRFLRRTAAFGGLAALGTPPASMPGKTLRITPQPHGGPAGPLDTVTVTGTTPGVLAVRDGAGREYLRRPFAGSLSWEAAGALGNHLVLLEDKRGRLLDAASVAVAARTEITDAGGTYGRLLQTLYWTMIGRRSEAGSVRLGGKVYRYFVPWVRDHVHTLKGMKYFYPELKSGMDLYADFQRADGMVWDNIYTRDKEKNWWDKRFRPGDFIRPVENDTYEFHRIPVEADVEYLFVEGLYHTWKATGDDTWMQSRLDHALKAVAYSTSDPYRWSQKHQLVKRGFTIDTWDFQSDEDTAISGGDIMGVDPAKTRFGIMFGDNTGMAVGCRYLAEMLEHAGRPAEAARIRDLGRGIRQRLDALAWNGRHYTHHVPEDPAVRRDLGVDQAAQVSLSNAYSLNRDLSHAQCVAIINTYQRIRKEMPATSPGEWYTIYPIFTKGFGDKDSTSHWEYMNGGVTPIVAGELARGAFEHGHEAYGADILTRIAALAAQTENFLHCTYRGAMPEPPVRTLTPLSVQAVANVLYPGRQATFNGQWIGHTPENAPAATKTYHGIPFQLLNPDAHPRTCLELNAEPGGLASASLPVKGKAGAVYLLHTMTPGKFAGTVWLHYTDGTAHADYITDDKIGHWWRIGNEDYGPLSDTCRKAWRSDNDQYVAFYVYGLDNPNPGKTLRHIEFAGAKQRQKWHVLAVTLSDHPVFFMPGRISHGIPNNWGAAAVVYGLVEGLAGLVDAGVAFDKARLSPRWEAAGVAEVRATAKYEASGGYLHYRYRLSADKSRLELAFTGTAADTQVELLLPAGRRVATATLNGRPATLQTRTVEQSVYATVAVPGIAAHRLVLELVG